MRLPIVLFTAVTPVLAQLGLPVAQSCHGSGDGVTISVSSPRLRSRILKMGAPYSGVQSIQNIQTLADGTHLTRNLPIETATWRDSSGRVRTEVRTSPGERSNPCMTSLVEIDDPVGGNVILLEPAERIAYSMPLTPLPQGLVQRPDAAKPASPQSQTSPDAPTFTKESLGEKTMFGLSVTGTRSTSTYPAGSKEGNDRPVTNTNEVWVSPQLSLQIYSQTTNYEGKVTVTSMKDLSIAEPDPSLFEIPAGYKVIDESGPFTINIPGHS